MNRKTLIVLAMVLCSLVGIQAATITVTGTYLIATGENAGENITINATSTITHDGGAGGGNITGISLVLNSSGKDARTLNSEIIGAGSADVAIAGGVATITAPAFWLIRDGANQSNFTLNTAGGTGTLTHQDDAGDSQAANVHNVGAAQLQLTVVPEPHEYAMMAGLGLLGFGVWRRKTMKMA